MYVCVREKWQNLIFDINAIFRIAIVLLTTLATFLQLLLQHKLLQVAGKSFTFNTLNGKIMRNWLVCKSAFCPNAALSAFLANALAGSCFVAPLHIAAANRKNVADIAFTVYWHVAFWYSSNRIFVRVRNNGPTTIGMLRISHAFFTFFLIDACNM